MFNTPELRKAYAEYQEALQAEIRANAEAAEDYARIANTLGKVACGLLPICLGIITYCLASL